MPRPPDRKPAEWGQLERIPIPTRLLIFYRGPGLAWPAWQSGSYGGANVRYKNVT